MSGIKRTPADAAFSDCIRTLAKWTCERCGGKPDKAGLHCSHFHGRGKWGTRFNPDNVESICYGCHQYLGAHPMEHEARKRKVLGDTRFDALREASQDTELGKRYRKTKGKGEIAKHFREQLKAIQDGQDYLVAWE